MLLLDTSASVNKNEVSRLVNDIDTTLVGHNQVKKNITDMIVIIGEP